MSSIDPATGRPLPADAIQRVLFIANTLHVYNIPPVASARGPTAADWTADPQRHIFTCRMRILETSVPTTAAAAPEPRPPTQPQHERAQDDDDDEHDESAVRVKVDIALEDPATGQLFAAAPYETKAAVEPAQDSSRFFALRVRDEAGRKATLGIGFEERSDAFDFCVTLQEAQKTLGWAAADSAPAAAKKPQRQQELKGLGEKRDYSLKEGETITVNLGGARSGRKPPPPPRTETTASGGGEGESGRSLSSFSLPPPPSAPAASSSSSSKTASPSSTTAKRNSWLAGAPQKNIKKKTAEELGFDDGQFGEFA